MKIKRHPPGLIAFALLVGLLLQTVPGKEPILEDKQVIAARYALKAPAIDGAIAPGEWRDAVGAYTRRN